MEASNDDDLSLFSHHREHSCFGTRINVFQEALTFGLFITSTVPPTKTMEKNVDQLGAEKHTNKIIIHTFLK